MVCGGGIDSGGLALNYSVRHFLEDERRLLATSELASRLQCVDRPDGRLLPLPTDPLRRAMTCAADASRCFEARYGARSGGEHERRFRLVVEYIDGHRDELAEAGLASGGETIAVREEFVGWLLSSDVESSIPESALTRFLDEWGHRWI